MLVELVIQLMGSDCRVALWHLHLNDFVCDLRVHLFTAGNAHGSLNNAIVQELGLINELCATALQFNTVKLFSF